MSILYHDDALVAVDKPAGMLVHRSPGARDPVVVMTFVRDLVGEHAYPVHRLDRDTSGIVLVAITLLAAQRLYAAFQKAAIQKTYLALVCGDADEAGRIEVPLEKTTGGVFQNAVTEYDTLVRSDGYSLLRVHPRNGRRHQIRRHLAGAGLPIAGDPIYGDPACNQAAADVLGLQRMALHAAHLCLPHPLTGELLNLEAPVPSDLADAWRRVGWGAEQVGVERSVAFLGVAPQEFSGIFPVDLI